MKGCTFWAHYSPQAKPERSTTSWMYVNISIKCNWGFFANTIVQCRTRSIWSLLAFKLSAVKGWNHTVDCCGSFNESFRIIICVTFFSHLWNWSEGMLNWLESEKQTFFEHQIRSCQLATTWANYEITSQSLSQGANLRVLPANKRHMFWSRCWTERTDW